VLPVDQRGVHLLRNWDGRPELSTWLSLGALTFLSNVATFEARKRQTTSVSTFSILSTFLVNGKESRGQHMAFIRTTGD
jgi:hypothetical protein